MALSVGDKLGHLKIVGPLGAGGMGEVYRALDTQLQREVAIKVLPQALAKDPERLARFDREAKILAALNHPNIAVIYGLESFEGGRAIVMELVPGETVEARIKRGAMPQEEVLPLAQQVVEALQAAHEKNVVHRDLKPGNVMITPSGLVKVLDFGLAAMAQPEASVPGDPENSPTLTIGMTQAGAIMGTAAYMSPEQARGQIVDRRSDIWAFGVLLYEMLKGQRLFRGATVSDILASVLKEEPDLEQIPIGVRPLLKRCLEKEPRKRLQAIGDWELLLNPSSGIAPPQRASRSLMPWAVAGVLAITLVALAWRSYGRGNEEPLEAVRFSVPPPDKGSFDATNGYVLAVSPDGKRVAFLATVEGKNQIWVRDLSSLDSRAIAGTENAIGSPFWSPDSRTVGFFAEGKLKKVDLGGGRPQTLCDANPGRSGTWNRDDVIVFQPGSSGILYRVSASGGNPVAVTKLEAPIDAHRFPSFLPDGRHFLYTGMSTNNSETGAIFAGDLDGNAAIRVLSGNSNGTYVSSGYLLFARDGTIVAQSFDPATLRVSGEAVPVAEQVDYSLSNARGQFSVSSNGVLAYLTNGASARLQVAWVDRTGKVTGLIGSPGRLHWPALSSDGTKVAIDQQDLKDISTDIWLHDLLRGSTSRFTFSTAVTRSQYPVWSPDGGRIAFNALREGNNRIVLKEMNGAGNEEILPGQPVFRPDDWSHDGRFLIEEIIDPKTRNDIWLQPLFGDRKPFPLLHSEFREAFAKLSPNGAWLAYVSDETNRTEVYVQSFPLLGNKHAVSTGGGSLPIWSKDGRELFYVSADGKMMSVHIGTASNFEAGLPVALFDSQLGNPNYPNTWYDVSKDGRFLIPLQGEAHAVPMNIVLNWQAGLKK